VSRRGQLLLQGAAEADRGNAVAHDQRTGLRDMALRSLTIVYELVS
jgi:hypothetical protein